LDQVWGGRSSGYCKFLDPTRKAIAGVGVEQEVLDEVQALLDDGYRWARSETDPNGPKFAFLQKESEIFIGPAGDILDTSDWEKEFQMKQSASVSVT
jgi:hypothetical protein